MPISLLHKSDSKDGGGELVASDRPTVQMVAPLSAPPAPSLEPEMRMMMNEMGSMKSSLSDTFRTFATATSNEMGSMRT